MGFLPTPVVVSTGSEGLVLPPTGAMLKLSTPTDLRAAVINQPCRSLPGSDAVTHVFVSALVEGPASGLSNVCDCQRALRLPADPSLQLYFYSPCEPGLNSWQAYADSYLL